MANRPDALSDVGVVVAAAGRGTRLGGTPKQFRKLGGLSLVNRTLQTMLAVPEVVHIVVALPGDYLARAERERPRLTAAPVEFIAGGETRQDSVRLSLGNLPRGTDIVLIHDAARPFVTIDEVQEVIQGVRLHGAAALAVPVTDTLRRVNGEEFGQTVSRQDLYRMQTPQGFRSDTIVGAHRWAFETGWKGTDDVELVTAFGHSVHVASGRSSNFKITTSDDWQLAERLWPAWRRVVAND